jgi:hypothetical protein
MWQYTDDAARIELAYRRRQAQTFIAQERLADVARCCRTVSAWWQRLAALLWRRAIPISVPGC